MRKLFFVRYDFYCDLLYVLFKVKAQYKNANCNRTNNKKLEKFNILCELIL